MLQPATHAGKPAARRRTFRRLPRALVLLALAAVLPAGAAAFPSSGDGDWSSGSGKWLRAVTFPDAAHGWATDPAGTILATTNDDFPPAPTAPPKIVRLKPRL